MIKIGRLYTVGMPSRPSDRLLQTFIEVGCPSCGYQFEVQLTDVRTQVYRYCPCCRQLIHLIDSGGSTFGALESIDNAMDDLQRTLRRMFR
jgi:hypothetical protein